MRTTISIPLAAIRRILIALVVVAVVVLGFRSWNEGYWPFGPGDDHWSGVFLTNGQAYFGHFYSGPSEYAYLREVYYVLATQLQPQDPRVAPTTQLTLQRLGGEIHGPTQEMRISKQQILFVEDLRADSTLVASIRQLRSGGQPQPQPAPASPGTTTVPALPTTPPPVSPTRSP